MGTESEVFMGTESEYWGSRPPTLELVHVAHGQRRFCNLRIDDVGRRAYLDERELSLTRLEYSLLSALSDRPNVVCTPQELLESVWGHAWFGDDHVVETHIGRLRAKLGESGREPRFIHTVRGVGYRFDGKMNRLHHIEYDASMAIKHVDPADGSVLGWQPTDLLGRFVIFDSRIQGIKQQESIAIAEIMAWSTRQTGPSIIGVVDAAGQQQTVSVVICFTPSTGGGFAGLVAHLLIDGGSAAMNGSWPDEGHGSRCPLGP